jgi:hypothetical protein
VGAGEPRRAAGFRSVPCEQMSPRAVSRNPSSGDWAFREVPHPLTWPWRCGLRNRRRRCSAPADAVPLPRSGHILGKGIPRRYCWNCLGRKWAKFRATSHREPTAKENFRHWRVIALRASPSPFPTKGRPRYLNIPSCFRFHHRHAGSVAIFGRCKVVTKKCHATSESALGINKQLVLGLIAEPALWDLKPQPKLQRIGLLGADTPATG